MKVYCYNHVDERDIYGFNDIKTRLDQELYDKKVAELRTTQSLLLDMITDARVDREDALADQIDAVYNIVHAEYERFTAGEAEYMTRQMMGEEDF